MDKLRVSQRAKKLSNAMRVVDEETRRFVQKNRLDALEGDRLFDEDIQEENLVAEGLQDWEEEEAVPSDDDEISDEASNKS